MHKPLPTLIEQRAEARSRQIKAVVGSLERFLNRHLTRLLERVQSGEISAANLAQTIGKLYEGLRAAGLAEELRRIERLYSSELEALRDEVEALDGVLTDFDVAQARVLIESDLENAATRINEVVGSVRGTMMRSILAGTPLDFAAITASFGARAAAQVEAELNTNMSAFNQAVLNDKAEELGIETFVYSGPNDDVTRDFCRDLLEQNKLWAREDIEAMQNDTNGKLPVMETGGGWNCRHQWAPLRPKDAEELGFDVPAEFQSEAVES